MNLRDQFDELFVGHVSFPLTNYLYNRKDILRHYNNLLKTEQLSPQQRSYLRLQKLKRLLEYSYQWVPFYKQRFDEIGFVPKHMQTLDELKQIPVLTRQDVLDNYLDLVDSRYRESVEVAEQADRPVGQPLPFAVFRKHKLVRNTSTGSTGIPTTFFEDGTTTAMNWVHELRVKQWFGISPGSRDARLARVSTQYLPKSTVSRFRKLLWNHLILPGVNLSPPEYTIMLNRMEAFQPKVIWGYTSALTGLADFIKQSGYDAKKLPVEMLISWAAPLYDHERILLEEVFGCPATNIYGTREVGHIAIECPKGTLHINEESYIVENEPSRITGSTEDPGEILVTPLYEARMPFIRYSIGDLGRVVPSTCECGRSLEVIDDLLGRTGEVFHTSDGHMIAPNFWCRFFMIDLQNKSVKKFQVIYEKTDYVRLKIVKKDNYTDETEAVIRKLLAENFPKDTEFDIQYVDKIDPKPSGKEEMVINKVLSGQ